MHCCATAATSTTPLAPLVAGPACEASPQSADWLERLSRFVGGRGGQAGRKKGKEMGNDIGLGVVMLISCSRLTVKPWAASWSSVVYMQAHAQSALSSAVTTSTGPITVVQAPPSRSTVGAGRGEESEERLAQTLLNFT